MLDESGMKISYFSDESLANTKQFARAIDYSITIHFGTVPSTRLNIVSYLSWTIEWMILFWEVVLKFDCEVKILLCNHSNETSSAFRSSA